MLKARTGGALLFLIPAACLCAFAQGNPEPSSGSVFRVNVNVAVLDAQVLSKKTGRAVKALTPRDFLLYENGVSQPIAAVSQDEMPVSVVFLFDLTDSVRPVLRRLAEGALQALQHLKPEDEAAVMVYAAGVKVLQDFTTDRGLLATAITRAGKMESPDAAFFNEGIFQAAARAAQVAPGRRRVIIWLTDNVPNIPSDEARYKYRKSVPREGLHSESDALAALQRTGTIVCTLLQRSEISDNEFASNMRKPAYLIEHNIYPPGDVYKYSRLTGGHVVESLRRKDISQRMADLIDQIRSRYAVVYRPAVTQREGKFHPVRLEVSPEVKLREGKLIVNAQPGYFR